MDLLYIEYEVEDGFFAGQYYRICIGDRSGCGYDLRGYRYVFRGGEAGPEVIIFYRVCNAHREQRNQYLMLIKPRHFHALLYENTFCISNDNWLARSQIAYGINYRIGIPALEEIVIVAVNIKWQFIKSRNFFGREGTCKHSFHQHMVTDQVFESGFLMSYVGIHGMCHPLGLYALPVLVVVITVDAP